MCVEINSLGCASPKWLILYRVGYKTVTQSVNQIGQTAPKIWRVNGFKDGGLLPFWILKQTLQFVFIVLLGLVFMGRHKCKAVACLSSHVKCNFYELLYCVLCLWRINLIWFDNYFTVDRPMGNMSPSQILWRLVEPLPVCLWRRPPAILFS